jgi:hypothetical protein
MPRVTRGYFGLRDNDHIVHVASDKDFVLYIWGAQCGDIPWWNSDHHAAEPIPRCRFYGPRHATSSFPFMATSTTWPMESLRRLKALARLAPPPDHPFASFENPTAPWAAAACGAVA